LAERLLPPASGCTRDHFAAHLDQAEPGRFLDFMHRVAPLGRLLDGRQNPRKLLRCLAKPVLNLDNHRSGSCGETWKHCFDVSIFYPGARLLVFVIVTKAMTRHYR
jgi:hypothetical protein